MYLTLAEIESITIDEAIIVFKVYGLKVPEFADLEYLRSTIRLIRVDVEKGTSLTQSIEKERKFQQQLLQISRNEVLKTVNENRDKQNVTNLRDEHIGLSEMQTKKTQDKCVNNEVNSIINNLEIKTISGKDVHDSLENNDKPAHSSDKKMFEPNMKVGRDLEKIEIDNSRKLNLEQYQKTRNLVIKHVEVEDLGKDIHYQCLHSFSIDAQLVKDIMTKNENEKQKLKLTREHRHALLKLKQALETKPVLAKINENKFINLFKSFKNNFSMHGTNSAFYRQTDCLSVDCLFTQSAE